jgi:CelD/BcsL family acetyltransferase involved in cellulose biosynthesis
MRRSDAVSIARVRAASDAEWDAAWLASDHATWFHSRAWAEIWAEYRRGEIVPAARVVEFSDGRSALLPLCAERGRGGLRHRASPAGTYGGWLAEDPLEKADAACLLGHLRQEVPGLAWRVCPWDPQAAQLTAGMGQPETTRALRLEGGFEELERRFSSGPRWGVRRALREGLEVGIAIEIDDWRSYYELYRQSLDRWGDRATSRYAWDLFAEIRLRDPENARLWVARLGREVVAGALVLYAPRIAAWWHASAAAAHFSKRPMNLLLHEMIRDACEQDLAIFDMGPSHAHGGVEEFKSGYATEVFACPMIRTEPLTWRTRLRRALSGVVG